MVRYLGWLANTVLFTLCCFLIANTANAIIAALLSYSPAQTVEAGAQSGSESRSWADREQITRRNLFHSTRLAVAGSAPVPADEELQETELPLKLWGTIAAEDPALSWASVEETGGKSAIAAVRIGDQIQNATIVGIERRRVVLLENGNRRSLSLDDEDASLSANNSIRRPTTRATKTRTSRRKQRDETRREAARARMNSPVGNTSSLYSQARIVPEIDPETNAVTGLKLSAIQEGSAFDEVGIQNGEIITEIDGVPVSEIGDSTKIMAALTDPDEVEIVTVDQQGQAQPPRIIVSPE